MNHRNPPDDAPKIQDSVRIVGDHADVFHVELIRLTDGTRALYMHGLDFAAHEGWFQLSDALADAVVRVFTKEAGNV